MLNPEIKEQYDLTFIGGESCLSLPGKQYKTMRNRYCDVTWTDPDTSREMNGTFSDVEAVVIQHEVDHLDGILVLDRKRQPIKADKKPGRNDLCPCGSGKKFKKCCLNTNGVANVK